MVRQKSDPTPVDSSEDSQQLELALPDFGSFEEALAHFNNTGGVTKIGDVAGDGYQIERDDEKLVNIPFLIIDWANVKDPETQRMYASIRLITADGRKIRYNNGSIKSGVYAQLIEIHKRTGVSTGIAVPKGLRKSEYWVSDFDKTPIPLEDLPDFVGPKSKAKTFYLDTAS